MDRIYGGVEAGGTKFVCAIGTGPENILAQAQFPTTTPEETLARTAAFFNEHKSLGKLAGLGIGSFGPVDLHPGSATYGFITSTPKPGWRNTSVGPVLRDALGVPVAFETDVNAAALGEHRWGAAQGLTDFIYITIGTGIGGGVMAGGQLVHGLVHVELGHIYLTHDSKVDPYAGFCPFHSDCFEGLASGPAMKDRWGQPAQTLSPGHPAWVLEANYIAEAVADFIFILSPQRIILGGGVMQQAQLFPLIRQRVQRLLNGYVDTPELKGSLEQYIVPPGLGGRAGVLGSLALAMQA